MSDNEILAKLEAIELQNIGLAMSLNEAQALSAAIFELMQSILINQGADPENLAGQLSTLIDKHRAVYQHQTEFVQDFLAAQQRS